MRVRVSGTRPGPRIPGLAALYLRLGFFAAPHYSAVGTPRKRGKAARRQESSEIFVFFSRFEREIVKTATFSLFYRVDSPSKRGAFGENSKNRTKIRSKRAPPLGEIAILL